MSADLQNNEEGAARIDNPNEQDEWNYYINREETYVIPQQETTNHHFMAILGRRYVFDVYLYM